LLTTTDRYSNLSSREGERRGRATVKQTDQTETDIHTPERKIREEREESENCQVFPRSEQGGLERGRRRKRDFPVQYSPSLLIIPTSSSSHRPPL